MPGDCSPSRSVVSKMITLSSLISVPFVLCAKQTKNLSARWHERLASRRMGARHYISRRMLVGRMTSAWSQAPRNPSSRGREWRVMRRRLLLLVLFVAVGFVAARVRRAALAPEPDHDPWSTEPPIAL